MRRHVAQILPWCDQGFGRGLPPLLWFCPQPFGCTRWPSRDASAFRLDSRSLPRSAGQWRHRRGTLPANGLRGPCHCARRARHSRLRRNSQISDLTLRQSPAPGRHGACGAGLGSAHRPGLGRNGRDPGNWMLPCPSSFSSGALEPRLLPPARPSPPREAPA